jgi:hypothetical protein
VLGNWQDKPCIQAEPKVDKNRLVHRNDAFAHLILWISIGLSTDATARFCKTGCSGMSPGLQDKDWATDSATVQKNCEQVQDDFLTHVRQSAALDFFSVPGFFFLKIDAMVYIQDMYTRIVVVVNGGHFLWTSPKKRT